MERYNVNGKVSYSKGNQLKAEDSGLWYKADYFGYEGASEYICSHLMSQTNIPWFVKYSIAEFKVEDKEFVGCVSKDFLHEGETLVTVNKVFKTYLNKDTHEFLKSLGNVSLTRRIQYFVDKVVEITGVSNFGEYLTMMLEWDAYILNEDRHLNNIAFIQDEQGNFKNAPLFDNGAAFLSDTHRDYSLDKNYLGLMSNVEAKPFSKSFEKQVSACRELYGTQLVLKEGISVDQAVQDTIAEYYEFRVLKRIMDIFERQAYLTDLTREDFADSREDKLLKYGIEALNNVTN